jgi:hypothetical protein
VITILLHKLIVVGDKSAGFLLVKLFSALSHNCFPRHFPARKMQQKKEMMADDNSKEESKMLSNDEHVLDWIQVLSYLLQQHQLKSQCAVYLLASHV